MGEILIEAGTKPRTLLGWRLCALVYDFFPAFGLWFIVAAVFTVLHRDAVLGGWLGFGEFSAMWAVTGLYATISWKRGGQTLGMRPWKLRVVADGALTWRALWLRYALGSVSMFAGGLGFIWAFFDRDKLALHDRLSGTRLLRRA